MLRTNQKVGTWVTTTAVLSVFGLLYLFSSSLTSSPYTIGKHSQLRDSSDARPPKPTIRDAETQLEGGVLQYTRIQDGAETNLLWLTLTYDNSSWGQNEGVERTFLDFLEIVGSQYDTKTAALGVLTSSSEEYQRYKSVLQQYEFPRITLFFHPGFNDGPVIDRDHRHDGDVQTLRRAEISKLRNYLMLKTLQQERHILWLDADVFHLDDGIVRRMVSHVDEREDVGILTARCELGGIMDDYDLNAWRGTRQGPRGWDLTDEEIEKGEMKLQGQFHVSELIKDTTDDDLVSLDTVGATILYLRASLIWRGLNFPHQYVVGTRWGKDGWDGIESEGLCYRAKGLRGGKCMVLGGNWHVKHTTG